MRKSKLGLQKDISKIFTGVQIPGRDVSKKDQNPPLHRPDQHLPRPLVPKPPKVDEPEPAEYTLPSEEELLEPVDDAVITEEDVSEPPEYTQTVQKTASELVELGEQTTEEVTEPIEYTLPTEEEIVSEIADLDELAEQDLSDGLESTAPPEELVSPPAEHIEPVEDVESVPSDAAASVEENVTDAPELTAPVTEDISQTDGAKEQTKEAVSSPVEQPASAKEDVPKPTVYTPPTKETVYEPPKPSPVFVSQKKPRIRELPKASRFMLATRAWKRLSSKLFATKSGVSTTRQKATVFMMPVLFMVFVVVIFKLFLTPGRHGPKNQQKIGPSGSIAAFDGKINWELPAPYPENIRDPMYFGASTAGRENAGRPLVKGIVYSDDNPSGSSVVIADRVCVVGDVVQGATVIKINPDSVEFEKEDETWVQKVER